MATLKNARGEPLLDAAGGVIKKGNLVRDDLFGEGIAKGTVPLQRGEGVNVLIEWRGAQLGDTDGCCQTLKFHYITISTEIS